MVFKSKVAPDKKESVYNVSTETFVAEFENGKFETSDSEIISYLIASGYSTESETIPEVIEQIVEPVIEPIIETIKKKPGRTKKEDKP